MDKIRQRIIEEEKQKQLWVEMLDDEKDIWIRQDLRVGISSQEKIIEALKWALDAIQQERS